MRFPVSDIARPKMVAKFLARAHPALTLSQIHRALAASLGYRDWHELVSVSSRGQSGSFAAPDWNDAAVFIGEVADALAISDGDVLDAVGRGRLLDCATLLDGQIAVRLRLWRARLFGPPLRGRPGTVVRDKSSPGEPAFLLRPGRPTRILRDAGFGNVADFEVVTPRVPLEDFLPSRLWLPYGYWSLNDGSEVLFSRDYLPLWRVLGDSVERLDPWLWIMGKVDQVYFSDLARTADWSTGEARRLALGHLERRRIRRIPKLVEVIGHLLGTEDDSVPAGVAAMRAAAGDPGPLPSFATYNSNLQWG